MFSAIRLEHWSKVDSRWDRVYGGVPHSRRGWCVSGLRPSGAGVLTLPGTKSSRRCVGVRRASEGDSSSDDARLKALVQQEMLKRNMDSGAGALTQKNTPSDSGVFWLCLANSVIYLCDYLRFGFVKKLYLYHSFPRWWQFITCSFCHASWQHLSSNLFMLYIFGKVVEEEGGTLGVILTYLVTAIGGSVAGYLFLPKISVSVGASSAVFGLFVVSVLTKLSWDIKKLLEAAILGQFVFQQLTNEIKRQVAGGSYSGGNQVSHVAHIGGAVAGLLLILLLSKLPEGNNSTKE